jgi:hypothetical protein
LPKEKFESLYARYGRWFKKWVIKI